MNIENSQKSDSLEEKIIHTIILYHIENLPPTHGGTGYFIGYTINDFAKFTTAIAKDISTYIFPGKIRVVSVLSGILVGYCECLFSKGLGGKARYIGNSGNSKEIISLELTRVTLLFKTMRAHPKYCELLLRLDNSLNPVFKEDTGETNA